MRKRTYKQRPGELWPATMAFILNQHLPYPPLHWNFKTARQGFKDLSTRFRLSLIVYRDLPTRFRFWLNVYRDLWIRLRG